MDYKEEYQKALERAKKGLPIDEVFPELKASEDERIREKLIEIVSAWKNREPHGLGNVKYISSSKMDKINKILAWLEKQKEQKSVMIQWTGKNLKEVIDFTGKSPKFGEWFKSWEDFENYVHNHDDILKLFCEDGSHYEVPVGAWIVKTPDGYNTPSRSRFVQKPAEWNEEDELMRTVVIQTLERFGGRGTTGMQIDWLKSLRPQPHWKPSEGQMAMLRAVLDDTNNINSNAAYFTLESLYDDLKKLI